jgi:hypothetical protein
MPSWHVSAPSQTVPFGHGVPSVTDACWHPSSASHVSLVHALPSLQLSAVPGVQIPFAQVSTPLQAFPSEHDAPFPSGVFWQTPALQTSLVHGWLSLQSPFTAHGRQPAIGVLMQPLTGLHESVVQAFPSLQLSGAPSAHAPA